MLAAHLCLQAFVSADLKTPIPAPYSATLSTCMVAATAAALSSSGTAAEPARTHLLPAMLSTYQQLALLACTAPHLQLGATMLASQALPTVAEILSSSYWMLPGFQAAAGVMSSAGRVSPAVQGLGARVSSSGAAGAGLNVSGAMFTGEHAVHLALQTIEGLVASTAAVPKRASDAGQVSKGMTGSCSTDCLCAVRRSGGGDGCQIGNAKCGMDGWCCCSSPKACSDITPPGTPQVVSDDERLTAPAHADSSRVFAFGAAGSAAGAAAMQQELPGEQQLLLVLSRLMQSKLLPELLRAVQQLPGATLDGVISPKPGDSAAGSFLGGFSRPASANGLTVNVPIRRGSLQRDARVSIARPQSCASCTCADIPAEVASLASLTNMDQVTVCEAQTPIADVTVLLCFCCAGYSKPRWRQPQGIQPPWPQRTSYSCPCQHPAQPDVSHTVFPVSIHG